MVVMETLVHIAIISWLGGLLYSCTPDYRRHIQPKFWLYDDNKHRKTSFRNLIGRGVLGKYDDDSLHCNGWAAFFYFTVDGNGKVKSFSVDKISSPTFSAEDSLIIPLVRKKLYNTEGKWHKHFWTSKKTECSFVLPYFRHTHYREGCTQEQIERRGQILMLVRSINRNSFHKEGKRKYKYWFSPVVNVPNQM